MRQAKKLEPLGGLPSTRPGSALTAIGTMRRYSSKGKKGGIYVVCWCECSAARRNPQHVHVERARWAENSGPVACKYCTRKKMSDMDHRRYVASRAEAAYTGRTYPVLVDAADCRRWLAEQQEQALGATGAGE